MITFTIVTMKMYLLNVRKLRYLLYYVRHIARAGF